MKTAELTGAALDWAVAKCEGRLSNNWSVSKQYRANGVTHAFYCSTLEKAHASRFNPSSDWFSGGPIIEREGITIVRCINDYEVDEHGYCTNIPIPVWAATAGHHQLSLGYDEPEESLSQYKSDLTYGPTPLIVAMRTYVASKLGDEIEIPEELK